jgi:hypothetical protein
MAFALLVNLSMEMFIPTPEEKNLFGIIMFYMVFNFFGSFIFLVKNYRAKIMGIFSLVLGFIFEFSFMRPDWVQKIYTLNIEAGVVMAFIISAFYWFIPWGIPSYILNKYFMKNVAV